MRFFDSLQQMLVILFAIAAGCAANRLGYLGGETDGKLSKILLNFTMPAMILSSVICGDELPGPAQTLSVLRVALVFYALEFLFAMVVPRLLGGTAGQTGVWRFALSFPNVGYIGYPVTVALFGSGALFYAVILTLPFNMLSFTLGPLMLAGAGRFRWRQLLSPCVVASAAALAISLTGLRPPQLLGRCLDMVGQITTPLSLMVVGSLLSKIPLGKVLSSPRLWIVTCLRLLVLPLALFALLRSLGTDRTVLGVAVALMGMPAAVNGSMLCMEYGGDRETMAQATLLTTAASILTIPLLSVLVL